MGVDATNVDLELESETEEATLNLEGDTSQYLELGLEDETEEFTLTLSDDTANYLELAFENQIDVIDTGGGGGDTDAFTLTGTNETIPKNFLFSGSSSYKCGAISWLTKAKYPKATSIGSYAFFSCTSLESVDFPKVTSIDDYAFYSCKALPEISLPLVETVGVSAFWGCTSLSSVEFPNATTLEDRALQGCTNLTSYNLPKLTTLGNYGFYECPLSRITLSEITSIGGEYLCCFCRNLTAFVITNEDKVCALTNSQNIFLGTPIRSGAGFIYVPDALLTSYKTATNWVTVKNYIKPLSELPDEEA